MSRKAFATLLRAAIRTHGRIPSMPMGNSLVLLGPLALLLAPIGTAFGDSNIIARVDVGFSGAYKAGLWAPVRVHFAEDTDLDGAEVSVIVPDGDGVPSRVSAPLPSPAPDSLLLYARFGRIHCPLTVRVERSGEVLAERAFEASDLATESTFPSALQSDQKLVVAVGTTPLGIADAIARLRQPADEAMQLVQLTDASLLPDRWYGYEGVALVVLSGTDLECYAGLAANDERTAALSKWVRHGGRLVIAVGEHGQQLLGAEGPLKSLTPGTFVKTTGLSQARELERLADSDDGLPARVDNKMLQVAQIADVEGTVRARQGNLPLVVDRVWGFGQVIFLASDLDRGPLGAWGARSTFVAKLLGWPTKPIEDEIESKAIRHYGFTDLAGQLRSGLDQFDGVWRLPFGLIAAAIVLYLLLIGPGDYFLLRKFLRRMELTWVTFPATVILFCALAYVVAHATKGDRFLVNQATLIDVDVETGELRGTAWANVFSPETRRLDVRFSTQKQENESDSGGRQVTAWLGLPGEGLGGMDPVAPPPVVWPDPYDFRDDDSWMAGMPVQVWSSKSLTTRWSGKLDTAFECDLQEKGPIPKGWIINRLDFTLTDCLLVYGDWVYVVGTLEPGQRFPVNALVERRELASFLTGRKLVFDEEEDRTLQRTTRYSIESTDPEYILRAMTFFQAAGGRPYTHLANSYQGFIDMSGLLQPDRAVLVGKAANSGTNDRDLPWTARISLTSDDGPITVHEKHMTLFRFVLPVVADE